jgi:hypothetical protein
MSRQQIRNDLMERIKDKHDVWFDDSIELYKMGRLKPHEAANDMISIMTYQIVWLLDFYDIELEEFAKGMQQTHRLFKQSEAK